MWSGALALTLSLWAYGVLINRQAEAQEENDKLKEASGVIDGLKTSRADIKKKEQELETLSFKVDRVDQSGKTVNQVSW